MADLPEKGAYRRACAATLATGTGHSTDVDESMPASRGSRECRCGLYPPAHYRVFRLRRMRPDRVMIAVRTSGWKEYNLDQSMGRK